MAVADSSAIPQLHHEYLPSGAIALPSKGRRKRVGYPIADELDVGDSAAAVKLSIETYRLPSGYG